MKLQEWKKRIEQRFEKAGLILLYWLGVWLPNVVARGVGKHFLDDGNTKSKWLPFKKGPEELTKMY